MTAASHGGFSFGFDADEQAAGLAAAVESGAITGVTDADFGGTGLGGGWWILGDAGDAAEAGTGSWYCGYRMQV